MRPDGTGRRWLLLVVLALCAAFLGGCQKDQTWKLGTPAPQITLFDKQDAPVKLSGYRGDVVVLRFWSSGCKDCVAGMPALDRYAQKYRSRGMTVLAVNMGESREVVQKFVGTMNLRYPVLRDPELIAAKKYHVTSVPTTFFIDRKGAARLMVPGEVSQQVFEKAVDALL
ncbi:thioredoxin [Geomonas limicola]|uniref:Thioredoxin n=1 Tax=Geomonas limicola TaxID=2740186 RepID=A0A6V8NAB1_9BACT|nr:TlpA disulfide reductase family protein [Geomonas limicola]GFO69441.1 thioredoxin [Geomonas limicola]